jgi:hypothetical protein
MGAPQSLRCRRCIFQGKLHVYARGDTVLLRSRVVVAAVVCSYSVPRRWQVEKEGAAARLRTQQLAEPTNSSFGGRAYHCSGLRETLAYDRPKLYAVLARVAGTPTLVVGWPPRLDGLKRKPGQPQAEAWPRAGPGLLLSNARRALKAMVGWYSGPWYVITLDTHCCWYSTALVSPCAVLKRKS